MALESKKYTSIVARNLGFALLTPLGTLIFQSMTYNKPFFEGNITACSISAFSGWLFVYLGYNMLQER